MILDLLQLTGDRYGLDAFEVAQYIQLSIEMEVFQSMGMDFDEAYAAALESCEII